MNDLTQWYDIDVRAEVLSGLRGYFLRTGRDPAVVDRFASVSVRDLMDVEYLSGCGVAGLDASVAEVVRGLYMNVRNRKYGGETFLCDAAREREIAYAGRWHSYLHAMLCKIAEKGDTVLFVGTADGREIPSDHYYRYYALEQLKGSAGRLDAGKVVKTVVGDFEDDKLIIDGRRGMAVIVALRCLMPNTRLDRFLAFAKMNIRPGGMVIMSHPMGFLTKDGDLRHFDDADSRRRSFEDRVHFALGGGRFALVETRESAIEVFYFVRSVD